MANKLVYGVKDKPEFSKLIVFALQQLLAIMAATIAVPILVGNGMSTSAAFLACVDAIEEGEDGVYMTEISGPAIPLPIFPKLGYKMVPIGKNWSYGVAALIFAAIEYKRCLAN